MPHFTERCKAGSVLAARASTRSAMPRCGCGRLRMYAKTGSSPSLAFAGLALPVMATGSVVATTCAAVRSLGLRAFDFALVTGLATGFPAALPLAFLTSTLRAILPPRFKLETRDDSTVSWGGKRREQRVSDRAYAS